MTDISCPLIVEVLNSERSGLGLFRLHAPFTAVTDTAGTITVDLGYTTDLASIPFFARWIIPQAGAFGASRSPSRLATAQGRQPFYLHQGFQRGSEGWRDGADPPLADGRFRVALHDQGARPVSVRLDVRRGRAWTHLKGGGHF